MQFLSFPLLPQLFSRYCNEAQRIDMALAWVRQTSLLDQLVARASSGKLVLRVLVGLDTSFSQRVALERLHAAGQLRLVRSTQGLFHPKLYIFHLPDRIIVWVGSANFTNSGFYSNTEAVAQFEQNTQSAEDWFAERWKEQEGQDTARLLKEYRENTQYKESKEPSGDIQSGTKHPASDELFAETSLHHSWDRHIAKLYQYDAYWREKTKNITYPFSVLDDYNSYISTIAEGNAIASYPSWDTLSQREATILLGTDDRYGVSGLLGSLRGAGVVKNIFFKSTPKNLSIRRMIHGAVQATITARSKEAYLRAAREAIARITDLERVNIATASRLLTLARPDKAISVNGGSADGLARLTGHSRSRIMDPSHYLELLQWLYSLPWYQHACPDDPLERRIWQYRAALVDAFVYDNRSPLTSR